jgi:hypothetical protein
VVQRFQKVGALETHLRGDLSGLLCGEDVVSFDGEPAYELDAKLGLS